MPHDFLVLLGLAVDIFLATSLTRYYEFTGSTSEKQAC
jgi:hypothetical protein